MTGFYRLVHSRTFEVKEKDFGEAEFPDKGKHLSFVTPEILKSGLVPFADTITFEDVFEFDATFIVDKKRGISAKKIINLEGN